MVTLRRPPQYQRSGPVLEPYQVVIRPLITEKATHISERHNAYTFEVSPLATKTEIKHAIETLFNVKVAGVRTQNRRGKPRRTGRRPAGCGTGKRPSSRFTRNSGSTSIDRDRTVVIDSPAQSEGNERWAFELTSRPAPGDGTRRSATSPS